jgi:hypothetical protein
MGHVSFWPTESQTVASRVEFELEGGSPRLSSLSMAWKAKPLLSNADLVVRLSPISKDGNTESEFGGGGGCILLRVLPSFF